MYQQPWLVDVDTPVLHPLLDPVPVFALVVPVVDARRDPGSVMSVDVEDVSGREEVTKPTLGPIASETQSNRHRTWPSAADSSSSVLNHQHPRSKIQGRG